jgi:hypothetical protein
MQDSYPISSKTISLIKLWLFTLLLNIKLILFFIEFTLYLIHIKTTHEKKHLSLADFSFRFVYDFK